MTIVYIPLHCLAISPPPISAERDATVALNGAHVDTNIVVQDLIRTLSEKCLLRRNDSKSDSHTDYNN